MKFILFILSILCYNFIAPAQNLLSEFQNISTNNDMMGGSLVVFCENEIIENIAIGKSDLSNNLATTVDTKYRIASISKTVTTIAIMQLVEQELLDLDVDISNILGYDVYNPNYSTSPITIRMLLSHTSSIIDGPMYNEFLSATVNDNPIPDLSEILTDGGIYYTQEQFNNTIPGSYFNYSNINYVILGTIVEKISNLRFDVYCKQFISTPLGIDASFNVNDLQDLNNVAVLYRKNNGVWNPQIDNYQGVQPIYDNLSGYIPGTNGGRFAPQGGFRCSGQDLGLLFLVLMNKGTFNGITLLSEESCNTMFANEWTFNGNNGNDYFGLFRSWGLGIHRITSTIGNDVVLPNSTFMLGHTGEAYGLVSTAFFDPVRKVGFVFLNNGVGIGYQTNDNSKFYTIEQEVFLAIENFVNIESCMQSISVYDTTKESPIVYPNPTNHKVYIKNLNNTIFTVKVYDVQGKLIEETSKNQINFSTYLNGIYILKVQTDQGLFIHKIIKE